jgi:hypothetical protein
MLPRQIWLIWMSVASRLRKAIRHLESVYRGHFEGAYNRERKLNLMMAISADRNYDMEWHQLWPQEEGGTNLFRMYTFIERIIDQLAIDWRGRSFCFTMDNLNIHHNPVLLHMIAIWRHRYLFRAPYWSVDGPMVRFILFCCSTFAPSTICLYWATALTQWLIGWQTLRITFFMYDCLTIDNIK